MDSASPTLSVVEDAVYEVDVTREVLEALTGDWRVSFKLMTARDGNNLHLPSREAAFVAFNHSIRQRSNAHRSQNMLNSKTFSAA